MDARLAVSSSHYPSSSAICPPHSVGSLSQNRPLPGKFCGAKVDGLRPGLHRYWWWFGLFQASALIPHRINSM